MRLLGLALSVFVLADSRVILVERYAESWEVGHSGQQVVLAAETVLPAWLGQMRRLTPSVHAPEDFALRNVWLSVCVPPGFAPRDVDTKVWTLQQNDGCARYSTVLGTVNRGQGVNPPASLFLMPVQVGTFVIRYGITSENTSPTFGTFSVNVKTR